MAAHRRLDRRRTYLCAVGLQLLVDNAARVFTGSVNVHHVAAHRGDGKRFIVRANVSGSAKGDTRVRGEFDLVTARAEACARMKS